MRILLLLGCCCLMWSAAWAQALRALSRQAESGVVTAMRHQLGQLAAGLPGGVVCPTCLMVAPQTDSKLVQGSVARSQLKESVRSHGLPQEVADRLETLAFARSVVFNTFSFVVSALVGRGHYETFVGAGRRLDEGTVEFGVIRGAASAQLVTKTTPVEQRSCKRRFFIKRCRSWTDHVPRGLTADELRLIEAALRHFAVASASQRLASGSVVRRSRRFADDADDDDSAAVPAATTISPDASSEDQSGSSSSSSSNSTLTELVRSGFDHLALASSTQLLRRIRVSSVGAFAAVFARSLRVPPAVAGPLREAVEAAVRDGGDGRWRGVSALFTAEDDPGAVRFVRLALLRRRDSFDLASATVRLAVRFADRVQLLTDGEGELRLRRLPASVTDEDLRQAVRILEAATRRAFGTGVFAKATGPGSF